VASIEVLQNMQKDKPFTSDCKDIATYENELKLISKYGLLTKEKNKTLDQFEFVLNALQENGVALNHAIRARIFEYATLNGNFDMANNML